MMGNTGFIKFIKSANTKELMKRPKCFVLLALIAVHAKRTNELNVHGLTIGEAFIGDHRSIGLTQQEYRTAKKNLEKFGLATFRGTNRGTIAKLLDKSIFDINSEKNGRLNNEQITSEQRTGNSQITTNNKKKNEKIIKEYKEQRKTFLKKSAMPQLRHEDLID